MAYTHDLTFDGSVLTKRYRSWDRGEHRREWQVLTVAHRHAPGLVPRPLSADLDADPPGLTMSVLPGEPLGEDPSVAQLDALAEALAELWAVPHEDLEWADDLGFARRLTDGPRPAAGIAADAYDAAVAWWDGPDPALLRVRPEATVLGHRDANLVNYLWDGRRIRIVDFEDARRSDPATELAILVEHLSARRVDGAAFLARFEVDAVRLRASRRVWAMFWLRLLLPGGPAEKRNPPGTHEKQAQRLIDLLKS